MGDEKGSVRRMQAYAAQDEATRRMLSKERREQAAQEFGDLDALKAQPAQDENWQEKLEVDRQGRVKDTPGNLALILRNDPRLRDIAYNIHRSGIDIRRDAEGRSSVPWTPIKAGWNESDLGALQIYLEHVYGLYTPSKLKGILLAIAAERGYHTIRVYLPDRGTRLDRTMRSYLNLYFDTPNSWLPYKRELKPGAEEAIYWRIGDICVSMRAADHLKMPERVDNVVEIRLSAREEKLYRQMERDMLLPYADGDVLALNAAALAGKLLQLAKGAVYDEFHNVRVLHDRKLDALEDLIEAANGKPVLVMVNYQHDLARIQQRFGEYGPENPGGVRELKTAQDMEDWNAGKIPVAATQPAATGHGLNLQQGGSTIVWFGLNWSLELYEQANARLWRQGQKQTVVVHHLVVKGTMDEQVMRALKDKAAGQNALMAAVKARIRDSIG